MKKISFVWSCFVMAFFVACQQAEVVNPEAEDLRMSISASINGQGESPQSRYEKNESDELVFAADDAIGLFIDGEAAVEWVYDGDGWDSGDNIVYWPDKTGSHTFHAFYPYAGASSNELVPMPSLSSQDGSFESVCERDFLIATTIQTYSLGGVVSFDEEETSFKHVSTLLKITLKGGGDLKGSTLTQLTIEGADIAAESTYSFKTEEVTLKNGGDTDDVLNVSLSRTIGTNDEVIYVIVNEKQLGEDEDTPSNVTLSIEYQDANGKPYVASVDGFANNLFAGGMCQSYTFTIKDSSLTISGSEIAEWGDGGSAGNVTINGEEKTQS